MDGLVKIGEFRTRCNSLWHSVRPTSQFTGELNSSTNCTEHPPHGLTRQTAWGWEKHTWFSQRLLSHTWTVWPGSQTAILKMQFSVMSSKRGKLLKTEQVLYSLHSIKQGHLNGVEWMMWFWKNSLRKWSVGEACCKCWHEWMGMRQ